MALATTLQNEKLKSSYVQYLAKGRATSMTINSYCPSTCRHCTINFKALELHINPIPHPLSHYFHQESHAAKSAIPRKADNRDFRTQNGCRECILKFNN
jgi:hypothetical protein